MTQVLDLFGNNSHLSRLARRFLWAAPIVALLSIAVSLLEGAGVGLLIPLLGTLTSNVKPGTNAVLALLDRVGAGATRDKRLLTIGGLILIALLTKALLQAILNALNAWVEGRVGHDIRRALGDRLRTVGFPFFLQEEHSRIVTVFARDCWKVSDTVRVALTGIGAIGGIVAFGTLLLIVNWRLSLLVLGGGLLARLIQQRIEHRLRLLSSETVVLSQRLTDRMLFTIYGARVIRLFGYQKMEEDRLAASSEKVRKAILKVEALSSGLWSLLEVLHGVLFLAILFVAVYRGVSLPVIAAFLMLMNRLQPHLRVLEGSGASLASAAGQLGEVEWLLDPHGKPVGPSGNRAFDCLREAIVFDRVCYEYPGRTEQAISDLNFTLRRGRSTALLGTSGAGKSTVINLLCRLLEPTAGEIYVDGQKLSEIRVPDWLQRISVTGQDIELIDGTIAENIAYGRPEITTEDVRSAVRAAQADFIDRLPLGLDTVVGTRGLSLSGGQRQRVGIARALARKPDLLILDEATNAVDQGTENAIIRMLQDLPKGMSLLLVSHRPSTIAFCDDAVVLKNGRVDECGPLRSTAAFREMQVSSSQVEQPLSFGVEAELSAGVIGGKQSEASPR